MMDSTTKIRIKDIAERAGVSVGTVDRIIHGRGNVSPISLERVQNVLDEIKYTPNHYAAALASHSVHQFAAILPMHEVDSYWARVEKGLTDGVRRFNDFKISFKIFRYDPFNTESFKFECQSLLNSHPDTVIIGPIFNYNIMAKFTAQLDEREIPYALLDSNWPEFNHRIFYGQDSLQSGAFSGRIMSLAVDAETKKIALFKVLGEGRVASRQQMNREVGFRKYMEEHCPQIDIVEVNLYAYDKQGMQDIMNDFFTENPDIRYALSFNSSIHIIANFLKEKMPNHPHVTLLGYDAVDANVECIKNGSADFLIAQHPQSQGLDCFRSMFNTCILKMNIHRDHYMAIELLTKENIDYYKD